MRLRRDGVLRGLLVFAAFVVISTAPLQPSQPVAAACPGLAGQVCGRDCQLHLCRQLASFYRATNNVSDPWDNEDGWQDTARMPCERILGGPAGQAGGAGAAPPAYCRWFGVECCSPGGLAARNCSALHAVTGLRMPINNLNASVSNPDMLRPLVALHSCGLVSINLEASNLIGSLTDGWGALVNLEVLNLGNCWLDGTIPVALRRLRKLRHINLSNNWLNGTLPAWLAELPRLRVLNLGSQFGDNPGREDGATGLVGTIPAELGQLASLRELNLEINALSGELPAQLCGNGGSNLLQFNVRANLLEGSAAPLEACTGLVQLDISDNGFSGTLPAGPGWEAMASYRAGRNSFTGTFPIALAAAARMLEHLDVNGNALTGQFPNHITLLGALKNLDIANNKFSGTLTEDVYYLPSLTSIDISGNSFVGTIPPAIGLAYSLEHADFSNNLGLTGAIPPELGLLSSLESIRITNTSLSCAGVIQPYIITTNASCSDPRRCHSPRRVGSADAAYTHCPEGQRLPCFLTFSAYLVPRDDNSNMRCREIVRRPTAEAMAVCGGAEGNDLGEQAAYLPELPLDTAAQAWLVDAGYYQYQACECLVGYDATWSANGTRLHCTLAADNGVASIRRTAAIVGSVAAVLLLGLCLLIWRQYLTTRPRWLRERVMQAKRTKGAPCATKPGEKVLISVVVTDVKDFSELTRKCPELMNKAMGGHNNILRKACHTHAGYVIDQEGDSWTIAFHEAEDAVGFSLQVQQALANKAWGMRLGTSEAALAELRGLTGMRDEGFSSKYLGLVGPTNSASSHRLQSSEGSYVTDRPGGTPVASAHNSLTAQQTAGTVTGAGACAIAIGSGDPGSFSNSSWQAGPPASGGSQSSQRSELAQLGVEGGGGGKQGGSWLLNKLRGNSGSGNHHHGGTLSGGVEARALSYTHGHADTAAVRDTGAGFNRHGGVGAAAAAVPIAVGAAPPAPATPTCAASSPLAGTLVLPPPPGSATGFVDGWDSGAVQAGVGTSMASRSSLASASFLPAYDRGGGVGNGGAYGSYSTRYSGDDRSSSKLWHAGAAIMRRFSNFGRSATSMRASGGSGDGAPMQVLRLAVRIGISTGQLSHGVDVANCMVKWRAKELVSDVANGGQVLLDEPTFLAVKDCLSLLGTVTEAGVDDQMVQQLMQAQVVHKLQRHIACRSCAGNKREPSFTSEVTDREAQDYENDAIVVHMGGFDVPGDPSLDGTDSAPSSDDSASNNKVGPAPGGLAADGPGELIARTSSKIGGGGGRKSVDAAAAAPVSVGRSAGKPPPRQLEVVVAPSTAGIAASGGRSGGGGRRSGKSKGATAKSPRQQLQLYSIASPGMRRSATSTRDLARFTSWSDAVNMKAGWVQLQKGYFDAPAARQMDLSAGSGALRGDEAIVLPEVTVVFASVAGASTLPFKRSRADMHSLNKLVRRCMLAQLAALPGGDGYLCRCHESDCKYMLAFDTPHKAVQWCLYVQEALMYMPWPAHVLAHPGFEEVRCPSSQRLLFRGPRLRMGLAEGQPNSVLPDHFGRANYYGGSVNRAARYMDAAAHGGQVVTDLQLLRKLAATWAAEDRQGQAAAVALLPPPDAAAAAGGGGGRDSPASAPLPTSSDALLSWQQQHGMKGGGGGGGGVSSNGAPAAVAAVGQLDGTSIDAAAASIAVDQAAAAMPADELRAASGAASEVGGLLPASVWALRARHARQSSGGIEGSSNNNNNSSSNSLLDAAGRSRSETSVLTAQPRVSFSGNDEVMGRNSRGSAAAAARMWRTSGHQAHTTAAAHLHPSTSRSLPLPHLSGHSFTHGMRPDARHGPLSRLPPLLPAASGASRLNASSCIRELPEQQQPGMMIMAPQHPGSATLAAVGEPVVFTHIGTFVFKGSGEHQMVSITHAAILGRPVPAEPPRGKGMRIAEARDAAVEDVEAVMLPMPLQLLAERQAAATRPAATPAPALLAAAAAPAPSLGGGAGIFREGGRLGGLPVGRVGSSSKAVPQL